MLSLYQYVITTSIEANRGLSDFKSLTSKPLRPTPHPPRTHLPSDTSHQRISAYTATRRKLERHRRGDGTGRRRTAATVPHGSHNRISCRNGRCGSLLPPPLRESGPDVRPPHRT